MRTSVDFVIITALREELDAVLAKLRTSKRLPPIAENIRICYSSDVEAVFPDGSTHKYSVIVLSLLGMGRVEAANATHDVIDRWDPRYVMLVGIAGGIAANKVKLGDLLLADQIIDYELQKLTPDEPEVRYSVYRTDPRLLVAAQHLAPEDWGKLVGVKRPRAGMAHTKVGPIASGDKVVAFASVMERYRSAWPKLIGVEMEAGGVASAIFERANPPGFFMVRGASDLADENKNLPQFGKWRPYAAEIAAAFTIALLQSGPIPVRVDVITVEDQTRSANTARQRSAETPLTVMETPEGITNVDATLIHVEDWKEWREEVRDLIEKIGRIHFRAFISRSSLDDVEDELRSIPGPIYLLIDLRLEGQENKYSGYRWVLEELSSFQSRHRDNTVFVISGNLHEAVKETLLYKGVEESHIYDKGTWAIQRRKFLDSLRRATQNLG